MRTVRVRGYRRRHVLRIEPSKGLRGGVPEQTRDVYIGNDPVATYRVKPYAHLTAEIAWVGVRGDKRGTGIGRQVVEKILDDLRDEGYERVVLDSAPGAIGFWEKMGFDVTEEDYDPDRPASVTRMETWL